MGDTDEIPWRILHIDVSAGNCDEDDENDELGMRRMPMHPLQLHFVHQLCQQRCAEDFFVSIEEDECLQGRRERFAWSSTC